MDLHFASLVEAVADELHDEVALVQGETRRTFGEVDDRAARFAGALRALGLGEGARVGQLLRNCPEYMETVLGTTKVRAIPINVNYRYLDDELRFVLEDAEVDVLVYHRSLRDQVAAVLATSPVALAVEVDDGTAGDGPAPEGVVAYEELLAGHDPAERIGREPDDLMLFYTGGTTGHPRGVMWDIGVLTQGYLTLSLGRMGLEAPSSIGDHPKLYAEARRAGRAIVALPASPLVHGTGFTWGGTVPLIAGGRAVLLTSRSFDADVLWSTIDAEGVGALTIVGDAFGMPMVDAFDRAAAGGRPYAATSLHTIVSSGAMFSQPTKSALFDRVPGDLEILDLLGATEGLMATNSSRRGVADQTASFQLGPTTRVVDDDFRDVEPGSGQAGRLAVANAMNARGYYKDEEKTARTFPVVDGVRYTVPGDWAQVEVDGTITLLGRGSGCINTGGEKVFPEEVEETIKQLEGVADALVVGLPDDRFGETVAALVAAAPHVSSEDVVLHVKQRLAGYKAPRTVVVGDVVPRNDGKPDYPAARALIEAASADR